MDTSCHKFINADKRREKKKEKHRHQKMDKQTSDKLKFKKVKEKHT